jgi:UDP-N-acetylmuramoylalanine--D-glutamate ligase
MQDLSRIFSKKKIAILGFGQEGIDSYLALRRLLPNQVLAVADQKTKKEFNVKARKIFAGDKKIKLHLGPKYLTRLGEYDLIIKTPGIPKRALRRFLAVKAKVTSQTEIFFTYFSGLVIGVTGTKGKGTTAGLIYNILKSAGFKVKLVGNIGQPVFQLLLRTRLKPRASQKDNPVFVYELSSHQLQNLKHSPHIAVFTNLFPDHLEYYKNFQEYQKAKENITIHQGLNDFFIYNSDDPRVNQIAKKTKAKRIPFGCKDAQAVLKIVSKKQISLQGDFNLMNIAAAVKAAEILGISKKFLQQGIKTFKPLPHRLEFAGCYRGIDFYDDSMATVPQTTQLDIGALGPRLATIILGGSRKGDLDFSDLAKTIWQSNIRTVILFPDTGQDIWQAIEKTRPNKKTAPPQMFPACSMPEAVDIAYQRTNKGEICLLAPASASFSLFLDYKQRGNLFKRYVKIFAKKTC